MTIAEPDMRHTTLLGSTRIGFAYNYFIYVAEALHVKMAALL